MAWEALIVIGVVAVAVVAGGYLCYRGAKGKGICSRGPAGCCPLMDLFTRRPGQHKTDE